MNETTSLVTLAAEKNASKSYARAIAKARAIFKGMNLADGVVLNEMDVTAVVSALRSVCTKGSNRLADAIVGNGLNYSGGARRFVV